MLKTGFVRPFSATLLLSAAVLLFAPSHSHAAQVDPVVTTYVVQRYDMLKGIASRYGVSMQSILNINDVPDPDSLEIGSILMIPVWDNAQSSIARSAAQPAVGEAALTASSLPATDAPAAADTAPDPSRSTSAVSARGGRESEPGLIWPLTGPLTTLFMEDGRHKGLDVAAPQGTPVVAAKSGTVRFSGEDNSGYGRYVIMDHADGSSTLYAHFSRRWVDAGDDVKQGQVVGYVGATGIATGPHLHFEVRQGGNLVDPLALLP